VGGHKSSDRHLSKIVNNIERLPNTNESTKMGCMWGWCNYMYQ
jgi:hypothetical protein